jgi:prephenate dehydratase
MASTRISYFGPPGSFTHEATLAKFKGKRYDLISNGTFERTFGLVYSGQAEYGVLPVENSTEGILALTYHLLVGQGRQAEVTICGEIYHRINLHLAALPNVDMAEIKSVHTKGIAHGQCSKWLRDSLPEARFEPENSTSAAAAAVASSADRTKGAIVGTLAADLYGLNVLARSIQDLKDNSTRFFVLGRRQIPAGKRPKKCTVALVLLDRVGAITDAFGILAKRQLNVRSVKVAPVLAPQLATWKDWFFVDIALPRDMRQAKALVETLRGDLVKENHLILEARILGIYSDSEPYGTVEERYLRSRQWGETPGFSAEALAMSLDDIMAQREREGGKVELKSTLRWNMEDGRKDKTMESVVLKTLAGFMNCGGGCLLIGIADDGEVLGLDSDYATLQKPDRDGFELHLRNIVKSALGADLAGTIEVRFLSRGGKDVCAVLAPPSPRPVWLTEQGKDECYVRIGNQTIPLSKKDTAEHIQQRWRMP